MIIESLLDTDSYTFSQQQLILHQFADTHVKYEFKCRNNVDLSFHVEQINKEIDHLCLLSFTLDELEYLRTIYYLKKDYIDFLEDFSLKRRFINVSVVEGKLSIIIEGNWLNCVMFEVPVLAIVQEIYMLSLTKDVIARSRCLNIGFDKYDTKMDYLHSQIEEKKLDIKFSDFGTRRRFSREWHFLIVKLLAQSPLANGFFTGSSNVLLSKNLKWVKGCEYFTRWVIERSQPITHFLIKPN